MQQLEKKIVKLIRQRFPTVRYVNFERNQDYELYLRETKLCRRRTNYGVTAYDAERKLVMNENAATLEELLQKIPNSLGWQTQNKGLPSGKKESTKESRKGQYLNRTR